MVNFVLIGVRRNPVLVNVKFSVRAGRVKSCIQGM